MAELRLKKGYILNSGKSFHYIGEDTYPDSKNYRRPIAKSFHYIGEDTMSWDDYQGLLERMKGRETIGKYWTFHQLKKGFGVLRIFACPEGGKPSDPELVERFETLKFHHSLNGGLLRKPQPIRVEFGVLKNKYDA